MTVSQADILYNRFLESCGGKGVKLAACASWIQGADAYLAWGHAFLIWIHGAHAHLGACTILDPGSGCTPGDQSNQGANAHMHYSN